MIPLLPEKHVRLNESLLGLGALIVQQLNEAKTIDDLWAHLNEVRKRKKAFPERIGFEDLILAVDVLYTLKAVNMNEKGEISRCV